MDPLNIPTSPGEVLDKITILEIKSERIRDRDKLGNVARELSLLQAVWSRAVEDDDELRRLRRELRAVNEALWQVEDALRAFERVSQFDGQFISLARQVYRSNDRRAALKRAVNEHLDSTLKEEKSYSDEG